MDFSIPIRLRIEFDEKTCVGNKACMKQDPSLFKFDSIKEKAILIGAKPQQQDKRFYILEKDFDSLNASRALAAAKACPVNAIQVFDAQKGVALVSNKVDLSSYKEVHVQYDDEKEFVLDSKGYFLIRADHEKKNLEVAFCNEKNKVALKVVGKTPLEIYQTIINKEKLELRADHYAYLGRELQKAFTALQFGLEYVQDNELDLNKKH